jgi:hypothetical protein
MKFYPDAAALRPLPRVIRTLSRHQRRTGFGTKLTSKTAVCVL